MILETILRSYLFAYTFWTALALGCLGVLLLHHTVGGRWGLMIRRPCEAGARTLPYMAVLFLPVALGLPLLYEWTHAEDPIIQSKSAYLNVPFFLVRTVLYFALWTFYAWKLSHWSAQQDDSSDESLIVRMRSISAPGLVVFTLTGTFAFIDWIMSLEPHWYSTMFGILFIVGGVLSALAFTVSVVILFARREPALRDAITPQHYHDLGNLIFAFTVLWTYLSFSQFLIIWAGNLPEEATWYLRRIDGGWGWVVVVLALFHFVLPFLLLLQRLTKRRPEVLLRIAATLFLMRIVDVFWLVQPSFYGESIAVMWTDPILFLLIGAVWSWLFRHELARRAMVPLRDPRLHESPRETVAY